MGSFLFLNLMIFVFLSLCRPFVPWLLTVLLLQIIVCVFCFVGSSRNAVFLHRAGLIKDENNKKQQIKARLNISSAKSIHKVPTRLNIESFMPNPSINAFQNWTFYAESNNKVSTRLNIESLMPNPSIKSLQVWIFNVFCCKFYSTLFFRTKS